MADTFDHAYAAVLDAQLRDQAGIYLANLGRPDEPVYLTPKENCRNCGAPPEIERPHACGWCLTPR